MIVVKRNRSTEVFNKAKIENAIERGLAKIGVFSRDIPLKIANIAEERIMGLDVSELHVDKIHMIVENIIMENNYHDLAREYITYRFSNKKNIFKKRTNLKPYEYSDLLEYVDAIRHSY
jgi:ribonucleoside-diphosphate reductase beta chain